MNPTFLPYLTLVLVLVQSLQTILSFLFCLMSCYFIVVVYLFFVFETESHCIAQADLKLEILQTQPPECWDYMNHNA
jgi:hypothetical protein